MKTVTRRLCMTIMFASSALFAEPVIFIGQAYEVETGRLLYTETHTLINDRNNHPVSEQVRYVDANGDVFGEKKLNYQQAAAPDYELDFQRRDRYERVNLTANSVDIFTSKKGDASLERPSSNLVVDAGFHYFILDHFDTLLAGKTVEFSFLSAGRERFFPMKIALTNQDDYNVELTLTIDQFLLSKLVKPIRLTYQKQTKQLLTYRGLTIVPDQNGKLVEAEIRYQYPLNFNFALYSVKHSTLHD